MQNNEVDASLKLTFPEEKRNKAGLEFRLIMSDPTGGQTFNPDTDGGADSCELFLL